MIPLTWRRGRWLGGWLALCVGGSAAMGAAGGESVPAADTAAPAAAAVTPALSQALEKLKAGAVPAPATPEAREAALRDATLRDAWATVVAARADGAAAVLSAARNLAPVGGAEDLYRLMLGGLLWQSGGIDRIDDLVQLWAAPALDFAIAPRLAYATFFQAARTRDPRVFPLLLLAMRDRDGVVDAPSFGVSYHWPETHELFWAVYGGDRHDDALRGVLENTLRDKGDPDFAASAAWLLARDVDVGVLPTLRGLALNPAPEFAAARRTAIRGLGIFGHPDDYALLHGLLKAAQAGNDEPLLAAVIDAFAEYGDLRAAKEVLAVAQARPMEGDLRDRTAALLVNLLTPEGVDALRVWEIKLPGLATAPASVQAAQKAADAAAGVTPQNAASADAVFAASPTEQLFAAMETTVEAYDKMTVEEKIAALAKLRRAMQADYTPDPKKPDGTPFTRADFDGAMAVLARTGEFPILGYEWVRPGHLLSAAQLADAPLFFRARASAARPLSPDALANMDVLSAMVTRLVRASYREDPGFCEEVKPPAAR